MVLQAAIDAKVALHPLPPPSAWPTIVRKRVFSPPPHLLLQLPHSIQSVTLQFSIWPLPQ
jgi:hypothetical protein